MTLCETKTYLEKKQHAAMNFAAARSEQNISETTPSLITDAISKFAKNLSGSKPVFIPVIADNYGLYGWCADGVKEKINHDGGSIVFGWTIWKWPQVRLTAEFHAVWESPTHDLIDITPKPHGETNI